MNHTTVHCGALVGVRSCPVQVEARIAEGLPGFDIVGLPERAVRESQVRVRAAIDAAGIELPPRRYVINLAPGHLRKSGPGFDVAIAVAVLHAASRLQSDSMSSVLLLGELSLRGELRPVRGVLAHLRMAQERGIGTAIIPAGNGPESIHAGHPAVLCADHLRQIVEFLAGVEPLRAPTSSEPRGTSWERGWDLADVRGQPAAKRALEIAAAGNHHLLLVGPPGAGKSMLARRLPGLLPPPTSDEAAEIATIGSVAGIGSMTSEPPVRPFRAPHHHATAQALIGGGSPIRPGEVTLAHSGVLFLDELPEFRRDAIEALRVTMESGEAVVARADQKVSMPARAQVVAAMNPCPCGFAGDNERICLCSPGAVARYRTRISGPLLDRFDMQIVVPRLRPSVLRGATEGPCSENVRERVVAARASLSSALRFDGLVERTHRKALDLLDRATDQLGLSARGYVKVLSVARTIAALGGRDRVDAADVGEAIQYRMLDRDPARSAA